MNAKEVAEIRRRFRSDKSNINHVRGCYVNEKKEIISEFDQSLTLMNEEEANEILALLKKTLSGTLDKNLVDIEFSTQQVLEGEEHKLLCALRDSGLKDEEAVHQFYERAIAALELEGNYMLMLASEQYDVFTRTKDGGDDQDSTQVFSYIICSVCPMKEAKPTLSYYVYENRFRNVVADSVISAPVMGFLFPAFDDRAANIYHALYYSRDLADNHSAFIDAVFHTEPPMAPAVQKETFQTILADSVAEDCSYEVVQTVHDQLSTLILDHKASKDDEPLSVDKKTMSDVLQACGVSEERRTAFEDKFDANFGEESTLNPANLVDARQFQLRTPDVVVKVNPERSDLVETRVIDGVKYILIRADGGVELNGVNISIQENKEAEAGEEAGT